MEKAPDDNKGPKGKGKRRQKKWNTSNTERNLPSTSKDSKSPDETVDTKTQNFGENVRENVGNKEVFKQKQNSKATKAPPTIKQEEATQQNPENAPSTSQFRQNPKKTQNKNQSIKQEEATQQQHPENAPSTSKFRQNPQKTQNKNQPIKQEEAIQQNPENAPSTSKFKQNPQKTQNKNQPIKQEEATQQQHPVNTPSTSKFRQNPQKTQNKHQDSESSYSRQSSQNAQNPQKTHNKNQDSESYSRQSSQNPQKTQNKNQDSESSYSRQSSQNAGKYNPPSRTSAEEPPIQSQLAIKSSTIDRETSIPKQISTIERGTAGQVFQVETNYLNINLDKMPKVAFHYDITIEPGRPKKFLRQVFEKFNSQFFKDIAMAFDSNKNVYTVQKLPVNQFEAEVDILDSNMKSMKYRVAIKETENLCIDLDSLRTYSKTRIYDKPMRALQCLDVVLSNPCHSKGIRVGRSFFTKPDQVYNLSDGYEMWIGLFQAAILGDVPFLNVDISNKSFYTESRIIDFLGDKIGRNNLKQKMAGRDLFSFRSYVKGVNVLYAPPRTFGVTPKMYKVFDVTEQSASQLTFIAEDQKKLTVADYFRSRGYNLLFPELNCLQVGSSIRKVYLPLELCKINGGQAPNKKDGTAQVQRMIKFAATSTDVRKSKIERALRYFLHNNDSVVHKFGIRIDSAFCKVPLRLLSPPSIIYKSDVITPARGAWRLNERTQFLRTNNVQYPQKWALIYHQGSKRRLNDFREFVSMFSKKAKQMNILLDDKPPLIEYFMIDEALRDLKRKKFDLVLAVLPNFSVSYADIKKSAELHHGILTQCIKENTIVQRLDSTLILNLLLKVNAKLNGTNHNYKDVDLKNSSLTNVMFLGADVTHPSPDQSYIPSVVGVAASHDAYGACYNMQYRLQRSSAEVIEDMESIVRYHLEFYKKSQNSYPENIIYYRDGVSDGQFPLIKNVELSGIRAACAKVKAKPKITCVVVVKRHHTRFFPNFKGNDKFNNVPPGSVVDRVIVHPNEVQFFMVSHVSVQGTARPTRYNVIEDDAKINIDVLQKLTYNMCHMFPRCNRSVSYPAPAYLAHLAAFRGRVYLEGSRRFDAPKKEYEKRTISPELLVSNPMYFV